MPTCVITLAETVKDLTDSEILAIRDVVAEGLDTSARHLDRNHIVVRVRRFRRAHMLGDMELEVFAQFYLRRWFSRNTRALQISREISRRLGVNCATWIHMVMMGYCRVTPDGKVFFPDRDTTLEEFSRT